jgi:3-oxoacyl-[acyl-carrier protein] reductase
MSGHTSCPQVDKRRPLVACGDPSWVQPARLEKSPWLGYPSDPDKRDRPPLDGDSVSVNPVDIPLISALSRLTRLIKRGTPMNISDQVVLVTGAGRGLGTSIARAFAREGARVVVNYLNSRESAEALVEELGGDRAIAICADVTDLQQVQSLVAEAQRHFGSSVTTVVDNALAQFTFNGDDRDRAETIRWESFRSQLDGSLRGALNTTQAVIPGMRDAGFGRIITIGTNLFQNPVVPYHDYIAAKAALLALTRTFAVDLGPYGITVNMASGGLLRTTDASAATPEAVFDFVAASTPLGRVVTPAEFADAVLFFASPWARSVTGQNLVVDGGLVKD